MPQSNLKKFDRIGTQCACANLRKASRALTNVYDEFLQPSALLATQFQLLSAIGASSVAISPLAEALGMDPTTLARNLKPLERDGLVKISTGTDRRTRMLALTDSGLNRLAQAIPLWEKAQSWVISRIGKDRLQTMIGDWSAVYSLTRP